MSREETANEMADRIKAAIEDGAKVEQIDPKTKEPIDLAGDPVPIPARESTT